MRSIVTAVAALCLCILVGLHAAAQPDRPARFIDRLEAGEPQRVVVYGTSLTADGAWVGQLEKELDRRYPGRAEVLNRGKGGEHSLLHVR